MKDPRRHTAYVMLEFGTTRGSSPDRRMRHVVRAPIASSREELERAVGDAAGMLKEWAERTVSSPPDDGIAREIEAMIWRAPQ